MAKLYGPMSEKLDNMLECVLAVSLRSGSKQTLTLVS